MQRWVIGHDLLKSSYGGNEDEFFKAIANGELIPYRSDRHAIEWGGMSIDPPGSAPLCHKMLTMEFDSLFLSKSDDELLMEEWDRFYQEFRR